MTRTDMEARDDHRLLREAVADGVDGTEYDEGEGTVSLRNGGGTLVLSGPAPLVVKAITLAKVQAIGSLETQRVLDTIIARIARAAGRHSPPPDVVTLEIGSSPNRMTLAFSADAAPNGDGADR